MAKKKKSKKSEAAEPKKKRKTITDIVMKCLDKNPDADVQSIYDAIVAGGFPKTKFNKSHLAWYKYQVRKGKLKLPSGRSLPPKAKKEKKAKKTKKKDK